MKNPAHSLLDRNNLNLVLDNLKLGIIAHTPERMITVFNKEAEKLRDTKKKKSWAKIATMCSTPLSAAPNARFAMIPRIFFPTPRNIRSRLSTGKATPVSWK